MRRHVVAATAVLTAGDCAAGRGRALCVRERGLLLRLNAAQSSPSGSDSKISLHSGHTG